MTLPFDLPPLAEDGPIPEWTGRGFLVGGDFFSVLEYSINTSGWTDDLTSFLEENAGPDHFIDLASRQQALGQLRKHLHNHAPVILEVGCSSGRLLGLLRANFPRGLVLGADIVRRPLERLSAELPGTPLFRFDLTACPLPDNSVDAVVLLNVLEHIENDSAAMVHVCRILKPGGIAVIEAPAGPDLYDAFDRAVMHFRRYDLRGLLQLAKDAHLKVVEKTHLGFFLYPGFWLAKKRNKRKEGLNGHGVQGILEENIRKSGGIRMVKPIMQFELFLGRWVTYPIGIRCLMTCVKTMSPH